MGRRNKLQKFAEILTFENVFENANTDDIHNKLVVQTQGEKKEIAGQWHQYFGNDNPITLELACGRGEYALALAEAFPDRNFIGVDIKGARIWQGAKIANEKNISNVLFLRTRIEMIANFFTQGEVDEIWITFPDPFLRESKSHRRLTSPPFLQRYKGIIKPKGILHLKTDDDTLYDFTLESIGECDFVDMLYYKDGIYSDDLVEPALEYKTYYEKMHLKNQKLIKYVQGQYA